MGVRMVQAVAVHLTAFRKLCRKCKKKKKKGRTWVETAVQQQLRGTGTSRQAPPAHPTRSHETAASTARSTSSAFVCCTNACSGFSSQALATTSNQSVVVADCRPVCYSRQSQPLTGTRAASSQFVYFSHIECSPSWYLVVQTIHRTCSTVRSAPQHTCVCAGQGCIHHDRAT